MNQRVERTEYLGFRLLVTPSTILISTSDGRPVCAAPSMAAARRIVRGYRRESKASA